MFNIVCQKTVILYFLVMGKINKHSWSDEDSAVLIRVRDQAILMQEEGDDRAISAIVHCEWKKLFPQSKASIGSLKICLLKMIQSAKIIENEKSLKTMQVSHL